jgi:hypothetical protein
MKAHPFLKAVALAALLVPPAVGAQQSDRADGTRFVSNVVQPFQALTALLKQVVESLSAA